MFKSQFINVTKKVVTKGVIIKGVYDNKSLKKNSSWNLFKNKGDNFF